jgi:hypothetical protein
MSVTYLHETQSANNDNSNSDCNKLYEKYYDDSFHYFKVMKNTFVLKN